MSDLTATLRSLYADEKPSTDADLTVLNSSAADSIRTERESGDDALQAILAQFVMNNATDGEQARRLSNALAGIKQFLVHEIITEFPTTSVEALSEAAEAAGYEIEVLS
ncbi:hypothetical protein ACIBED_07115 [Rhodococcus coprophilus]|uniref:Uncharacterized protein n=1 Tax=Rhodococcus coprophilus TaxID=38310 RepID=A0A2X4UDA4_9NOCA|nr:hypothetical protein [Rhodococcus coprophilus]MBM7459952.1 hypothetical protein [Rhodococcus coprophilus]SQI37776.1 Uncharacterised protein [Rhodococcus coprophilus]